MRLPAEEGGRRETAFLLSVRHRAGHGPAPRAGWRRRSYRRMVPSVPPPLSLREALGAPPFWGEPARDSAEVRALPQKHPTSPARRLRAARRPRVLPSSLPATSPEPPPVLSVLPRPTTPPGPAAGGLLPTPTPAPSRPPSPFATAASPPPSLPKRE